MKDVVALAWRAGYGKWRGQSSGGRVQGCADGRVAAQAPNQYHLGMRLQVGKRQQEIVLRAHQCWLAASGAIPSEATFADCER